MELKDWGDRQPRVDLLLKAFRAKEVEDPSKHYPVCGGLFLASEIIHAIEVGAPVGVELVSIAGIVLAAVGK